MNRTLEVYLFHVNSVFGGEKYYYVLTNDVDEKIRIAFPGSGRVKSWEYVGTVSYYDSESEIRRKLCLSDSIEFSG